ncbi:FAD/NAD(P)-binding domain-containing protein [Mycena vitilis]|nr:FAD/NAD(P)-binding domain-containing protein [Mycena vitilis]
MSHSAAEGAPLSVAIIGGGLGGLSAAIAIRRQGHLVKANIAEISSQIGAAIAVPPNSVRVLEAFGFKQENLRSCEYRGVVAYSDVGGEGRTVVFKDHVAKYGFQGRMCHRAALHEELKRLAAGGEGVGTPVQIFLGTEIVDCDPDAGTLTTKAGDKYEADVIVAADGIHSKMRTIVLGHPMMAPASGMCAFRWMVDASRLEGRPELDWVIKDGISGARLVTGAKGHNIFLYPCEEGRLINVAMFHPDTRDQDQHSWYTRTTRENVLEVYKESNPQFKAFVELASDPINVWQIRALPLLPTWTRGRLALLGDAAHATFPTLGQGAAMAVEDGAALACMLPYGTRPEEVSSRLVAYQDVRKTRDEFVNTESVEQSTIPSKRGQLHRSEEMQDFLNGYDAIAVAQAHFKKTFVEP